MRKFLLLITFALTILVWPVDAYAQESPTMKKRQKELLDTKEMRANEERAAEAELKRRHMANQSKEVRKRMKRNQKRTKRMSQGKPGKRGSGFKGLFKRKKGF